MRRIGVAAALLSLIALAAWRFDRWMQAHYGDCVYLEDDDD